MQHPITITALTLIGTIALGAEETVSKVVETDSNKDGVPDLRMESEYRSEKCVMRKLSRKIANGEWQLKGVSLYADGKLVVIESDENDDGFLESVEVKNPSTETSERYIRDQDWSLRLSPTEDKAPAKSNEEG